MHDPINVRRNAPEIEARGLTPRQIEDWTHKGLLSRIQPHGAYSPALVRLSELDALLDAGTIPATDGPLADGSLGAQDAVGRLLAAYVDDPGRYQRAISDLVAQIDRALWGEM